MRQDRTDWAGSMPWSHSLLWAPSATSKKMCAEDMRKKLQKDPGFWSRRVPLANCGRGERLQPALWTSFCRESYAGACRMK